MFLQSVRCKCYSYTQTHKHTQLVQNELKAFFLSLYTQHLQSISVKKYLLIALSVPFIARTNDYKTCKHSRFSLSLVFSQDFRFFLSCLVHHLISFIPLTHLYRFALSTFLFIPIGQQPKVKTFFIVMTNLKLCSSHFWFCFKFLKSISDFQAKSY